jgi:hypothetical protein
MNTVISGYTLTPINNHNNFGEYKLSIHKFNTTKCHTTYLINDPDSTTKRIHNGHIFLLSNSIDWLTDYCLMFSKQYFSYIQDENKFNIYKLYRTGWKGWVNLCVFWSGYNPPIFCSRSIQKRSPAWRDHGTLQTLLPPDGPRSGFLYYNLTISIMSAPPIHHPGVYCACELLEPSQVSSC